MAKNATRKPRGFGAFDRLCRRLAQVPKEEVDARIESDRVERERIRRKKK